MQKADRDTFLALCLKLKIPSKDEGLTTLRPWGTQMYVIDRIFKDIKNGIRHFTILKGGQQGITTISVAFDLYWQWCNQGVVGSFIADDDERRHYFNGLVRSYIRSLDPYPEYRIPVRGQNGLQISFDNESVLNFTHANKKQKGKLGRGIGTALLHCTECAFWDDQEGFSTLLERVSMVNPSALAIFESTANGHNHFKDKWETAKRASDQSAIFVGWWLHHSNRCPKQSAPYQVYWEQNQSLDKEERLWTEIVKRRYGYEVTPEQIAWWRAKLNDIYGAHSNYEEALARCYQENPPTEDFAFQFSGRTFIDKKSLNYRIAEVSESPEPRAFRFQFSENFLDTRMLEIDPQNPYAELKIWEPPCFGRGVVYSIGVDPCHGSAQESADAGIQIIRCYNGCLEQVAEFRSRAIEPYKLARVILYLSACYSNDTMWGIELQGGGSEVFQEMDRIKQRQSEKFDKEILKHFSRLSTYMYSRSDAKNKNFVSKHFHTTERVRDEVLEIVRTQTCDPSHCRIHSRALVEQIGMLIRNPTTGGPGSGEVGPRIGIDLVMSFGFALKIWDEHLRFKLANTIYTYGYEEFERERRNMLDPTATYSMSDMIQDRLLNWRRNLPSGAKPKEIA